MLVDLSHPLETGMPVFPGDPEVRIEPALAVPEDGVAVARLDLGSHTGTHIDAPSHSVVGGATVDELPLEWLVGDARVLRVTDPRADTAYGIDDLAEPLPERLPPAVLIATGWDTRFGSDAAFAHPFVDADLAERLWGAGARVLGVDTLSPDSTPRAVSGAGLPVHEQWLGRGGAIVENLRGLGQLPANVRISLLPLRIFGGDGSPIRAIAETTVSEAVQPPDPRDP